MDDFTVEKYQSRRKPKGVTARLRARKRRKEGPVVKAVRAKCVERDGYCRLMGLGFCAGPSQWCHLGEKKRSKTRGLPPEERHTTVWSFMGCEGHHGAYDAGEIGIEPVDAEKGANGHLRVTVDGVNTYV